ncbi:MAG: RpoL/Rpb11 RNA polymerase subunit family protein [Candidatus Odinarchaeota archaeon]
MEINKLRKNDRIFEFEISGEDHNYLNLLRVFLRAVESVEIAAYRSVMHSVPVFYVRTNGSSDPIDVVREANNNIVAICEELESQLSDASK